MNKFCKLSYGTKWRAYQKKAVGRDRWEELQIIDAREYFTEVRNAHERMLLKNHFEAMNGWFKEVYGKTYEIIPSSFIPDGIAYLIGSNVFTGNHK